MRFASNSHACQGSFALLWLTSVSCRAKARARARWAPRGAEKFCSAKFLLSPEGGLKTPQKKLPNGSFLKRKILFVEHESADNESDNADEREHTKAYEEVEPTCQDHACVEQRDD